jgi:ankyrin repeat protein
VIHDAITQWIDPLPMIELLATAGADLSVRLNGRTLLHVAARDGSVEAVTWLLDHGADVNATNTCDDSCPELGQTPLFDLQHFHDEATGILLEHGADPLVRSANGQTALHVAAVVGTIGGAFELCRYGTDPTITDAQGRTAQDLALAADMAGRDTERRALVYGPGEQADCLKPGGGCEILARRVAATGAPVDESDAAEVFADYACARDTRHCAARK